MSLTSKSNRNAKKFRIVFLGDQGVGKTSIIERYSTDKFDENYNSTVGIDFNVKDINKNGMFYRLQMWDTAGQERYRSLIPTYLKNAHCVVFVFDISRSKSLEDLLDWYKLFTDNQEAPGIVVANKIDLSAARQIERVEGEKFSKQINLRYIEVSAKTGKKIDELFDMIVDLITEKEREYEFQDASSKGLEEANQIQLGKGSKKIELGKQGMIEKASKKCCAQG